jgi:uncharacterized protein
MADRFVKDPHAVVKSGDLVKVRVMEIDLARKRIALSMRLGDVAPERSEGDPGALRHDARVVRPKAQTSPPSSARPRDARSVAEARAPARSRQPGKGVTPARDTPVAGGAMADAFAKAKRR